MVFAKQKPGLAAASLLYLRPIQHLDLQPRSVLGYRHLLRHDCQAICVGHRGEDARPWGPAE